MKNWTKKEILFCLPLLPMLAISCLTLIPIVPMLAAAAFASYRKQQGKSLRPLVVILFLCFLFFAWAFHYRGTALHFVQVLTGSNLGMAGVTGLGLRALFLGISSFGMLTGVYIAWIRESFQKNNFTEDTPTAADAPLASEGTICDSDAIFP